jgi:hypothetical protein
VQQALGVAFRYENVHLVPDMYLFQPGHAAWVQAANSFLGEQLLFGSSYPSGPSASRSKTPRPWAFPTRRWSACCTTTRPAC